MNVVGYCLIAVFVALMTYVGYRLFRSPMPCGGNCDHRHDENESR